jgi:hypothetical protein
MLGIRCPDRHALPRITLSIMRGPRRVLPPASGFVQSARCSRWLTTQRMGENAPFRPFPLGTRNGKDGWKAFIRCFLRWSAEVAGNGGQQCGARVVK